MRKMRRKVKKFIRVSPKGKVVLNNFRLFGSFVHYGRCCIECNIVYTWGFVKCYFPAVS